MLGLKACATTAWPSFYFFETEFLYVIQAGFEPTEILLPLLGLKLTKSKMVLLLSISVLGAREMAQMLRVYVLLVQRTEVQFLAHMSDSSQLYITIAPRRFDTLFKPPQVPPHMAQIHR